MRSYPKQLLLKNSLIFSQRDDCDRCWWHTLDVSFVDLKAVDFCGPLGIIPILPVTKAGET